MLFGLALIAIPLLVAVLTAAVHMQQLTDSGQKIVLDSAKTARLGQDMLSQIAQLERAAGLYTVLYDKNWLEQYRSQDAGLTTIRGQLDEHLKGEDAHQAVAKFGALQESIRLEVVSLPPPPPRAIDAARANEATRTALARRFSDLATLADKVTALGNAQIDSEVTALGEQTLIARRRLLLQTATLVPLTVIAILALTLLVGRPLRQLDRAISELGQGTFSNQIAVSGPHDLERLGGQLEWLRQRLLDLAHERNRFLRHMSHELKTPLANIREGTELLMDGAVGELDSNQREVTAILRENGIKLQRMIENLLSFSAWQTSSVGLEPSEFRLRPVVKQVLENQQLTLLSQRVRLDVRVADVTLVADRSKMRLILENLVSNAVKYSPKGGTIHLRAANEGMDLVLDVADSGPGIPKEDREHIFDAFYTGRASKNSSVKGTGIGLSVVLEFVSAHGGTVQIVDGEFPGAHFRITMPMIASGGDSPGQTPDHKTHAHAA
jgi:two-component system, NtrC family, sensor histidine kinase GlrK